MNKLGEFLNKTTEIKHGERLYIIASTLILGGMVQVLNHKLYKSRMAGIEKNIKIQELEETVNILKPIEFNDTEEDIQD